MSGYLLDANIVNDLIRHPDGAAARRIEQIDAKDICTSIIVAAELYYGCAKKGSARLLAKVTATLQTIPVVPRPTRAMVACARRWRQRGRPSGGTTC